MRSRPAADERLCATGRTGYAVMDELHIIRFHTQETVCRCGAGWLTRDGTRFFSRHGYT